MFVRAMWSLAIAMGTSGAPSRRLVRVRTWASSWVMSGITSTKSHSIYSQVMWQYRAHLSQYAASNFTPALLKHE